MPAQKRKSKDPMASGDQAGPIQLPPYTPPANDDIWVKTIFPDAAEQWKQDARAQKQARIKKYISFQTFLDMKSNGERLTGKERNALTKEYHAMENQRKAEEKAAQKERAAAEKQAKKEKKAREQQEKQNNKLEKIKEERSKVHVALSGNREELYTRPKTPEVREVVADQSIAEKRAIRSKNFVYDDDDGDGNAERLLREEERWENQKRRGNCFNLDPEVAVRDFMANLTEDSLCWLYSDAFFALWDSEPFESEAQPLPDGLKLNANAAWNKPPEEKKKKKCCSCCGKKQKAVDPEHDQEENKEAKPRPDPLPFEECFMKHANMAIGVRVWHRRIVDMVKFYSEKFTQLVDDIHLLNKISQHGAVTQQAVDALKQQMATEANSPKDLGHSVLPFDYFQMFEAPLQVIGEQRRIAPWRPDDYTERLTEKEWALRDKHVPELEGVNLSLQHRLPQHYCQATRPYTLFENSQFELQHMLFFHCDEPALAYELIVDKYYGVVTRNLKSHISDRCVFVDPQTGPDELAKMSLEKKGKDLSMSCLSEERREKEKKAKEERRQQKKRGREASRGTAGSAGFVLNKNPNNSLITTEGRRTTTDTYTTEHNNDTTINSDFLNSQANQNTNPDDSAALEVSMPHDDGPCSQPIEEDVEENNEEEEEEEEVEEEDVTKSEHWSEILLKAREIATPHAPKHGGTMPTITNQQLKGPKKCCIQLPSGKALRFSNEEEVTFHCYATARKLQLVSAMYCRALRFMCRYLIPLTNKGYSVSKELREFILDSHSLHHYVAFSQRHPGKHGKLPSVKYEQWQDLAIDIQRMLNKKHPLLHLALQTSASIVLCLNHVSKFPMSPHEVAQRLSSLMFESQLLTDMHMISFFHVQGQMYDATYHDYLQTVRPWSWNNPPKVLTKKESKAAMKASKKQAKAEMKSNSNVKFNKAETPTADRKSTTPQQLLKKKGRKERGSKPKSFARFVKRSKKGMVSEPVFEEVSRYPQVDKEGEYNRTDIANYLNDTDYVAEVLARGIEFIAVDVNSRLGVRLGQRPVPEEVEPVFAESKDDVAHPTQSKQSNAALHDREGALQRSSQRGTFTPIIENEDEAAESHHY